MLDLAWSLEYVDRSLLTSANLMTCWLVVSSAFSAYCITSSTVSKFLKTMIYIACPIQVHDNIGKLRHSLPRPNQTLFEQGRIRLPRPSHNLFEEGQILPCGQLPIYCPASNLEM